MIPGAQESPLHLAKLQWQDPQTGAVWEYVLQEGATASIGRHDDNDIVIREQHVSRQHAVINFRDGLFVITDLSANGTYVNGQRLTGPFPLASGDEIRLFVPTIRFSAVVTPEEQQQAERSGTLISAITSTGRGRLILTGGPQAGETIPLLVKKLVIGRATTGATYDVCLRDPSVSRPHARLELGENRVWLLYDLGSANGTFVNGTPVSEKGRALRDGDVLTMGTTIALFRLG